VTTDDTTAPVTADPATVTASFDDVAQVAQHLKTYGEGEVWHSACRLLDALRAASERAPVTAEGLRERLTEVATNWMRMYPFANYGFFSCADGDSLGQVHTIADSIAAAWGRDIADRMLAALAGDPGDLPARMAEAIEARVKASVLPERPPYDGSVGLAHFVGASFADLAAAALSVRDEHLVHLTARAEHAEAELSSRIEQHQRAVTRAIAAEGDRPPPRRQTMSAEITPDLSDESRCISVHWSFPIQCDLPRSHRENWHEVWSPETGDRIRYRRAFGVFRTEEQRGGVWVPLDVPPPDDDRVVAAETERDALKAAIRALTSDWKRRARSAATRVNEAKNGVEEVRWNAWRTAYECLATEVLAALDAPEAPGDAEVTRRAGVDWSGNLLPETTPDAPTGGED